MSALLADAPPNKHGSIFQRAHTQYLGSVLSIAMVLILTFAIPATSPYGSAEPPVARMLKSLL